MLNRGSAGERPHRLDSMNDIPPAPYLSTDDPSLFESTPLASAGWYDEGQHGGVVSALCAHAIEAVPSLTVMEIARLTVELFRVVPIVPLKVTTEVLREGKKIQVVAASVVDPAGTELARAVALRLRRTRLALPQEATTGDTHLPPPDTIASPDMTRWGIGDGGRILYHRHAIEVREVGAGFTEPGPGAMWLRIHRPLVEGHPLTPTTRAIITGDFVNGLSRLADARNFAFMNADLTIHLNRPPAGEWVGVEAVSTYEPTGRGLATGVLSDTKSPFGRATQTLFLDAR
ncbi:thioesterase family protein [soil metagenome]